MYKMGSSVGVFNSYSLGHYIKYTYICSSSCFPWPMPIFFCDDNKIAGRLTSPHGRRFLLLIKSNDSSDQSI